MIIRFHYDDYQRNKLSLLNLHPDITNKFDTLRIANPELPLQTVYHKIVTTAAFY